MHQPCWHPQSAGHAGILNQLTMLLDWHWQCANHAGTTNGIINRMPMLASLIC